MCMLTHEACIGEDGWTTVVHPTNMLPVGNQNLLPTPAPCGCPICCTAEIGGVTHPKLQAVASVVASGTYSANIDGAEFTIYTGALRHSQVCRKYAGMHACDCKASCAATGNKHCHARQVERRQSAIATETGILDYLRHPNARYEAGAMRSNMHECCIYNIPFLLVAPLPRACRCGRLRSARRQRATE
jgi:hypothetical protein